MYILYIYKVWSVKQKFPRYKVVLKFSNLPLSLSTHQEFPRHSLENYYYYVVIKSYSISSPIIMTLPCRIFRKKNCVCTTESASVSLIKNITLSLVVFIFIDDIKYSFVCGQVPNYEKWKIYVRWDFRNRGKRCIIWVLLFYIYLVFICIVCVFMINICVVHSVRPHEATSFDWVTKTNFLIVSRVNRLE